MYATLVVGLVHADPPTIAAGLSKLTYREPSLGVTHEAWLPTLQGRWSPNGLQDTQWPVWVEGQIASGYGDYAGSGTMHHQPIHLLEVQVKSPQDEWLEGYRLVPGVGYRRFYNDARGVTSTGAEGYRRTSEYGFVSLGVEQALDSGWLWTGQVRYLLLGQQTTQLGDVRGDWGQLGTVKNMQHRGYGLHVGACKTIDAWDVCPSVEHWRIADSDTVSGRVNGTTYLMTEPANTTTTFQMLVRYKY